MASDLLWQNSSAPTDGAIGDINTMRVDPSHLGMAQDVIIDTNGVLRSRGAVKSITADTFTLQYIMGIVQNQNGTAYIAADSAGDSYLYGTSSSSLTGFAKLTSGQYNNVTANSLTIAGQYGVWNSAKIPGERGAVFCNQRALPGAAWPSATIIWGGNATTTSDTSAGTAASTIGTAAIVGVGTAWTTALNNCFLFINNSYVGQVAQVSSTTTLTLYKGANRTVAANTPLFKTGRTTGLVVYKGRVTTSTTSAVVVGSNTKFANSGPAGGGSAYVVGRQLFRYRDGAFVGTVTSVQNDGTLTLTGNAAIAMTNEEYYLYPATGMSNIIVDLGAAFFGSCVETWAGRFWYGGINAYDNTGTPVVGVNNVFGPYNLNAPNTIAFTKKDEPEFFDLDPSAGDFLTLPSSNTNDQIRALCATRGGLVVLRNNDTFLVTGYSPETFRVIKILDDGVVNSTATKVYKEGVIWAGQRSVWYYDGTRIVNLLDNKLSRFYKRSKLLTIANPPGLAISNDHVLLSFGVSNLTWPYKATTKTLSVATIVINLANGACTFFTNLCVSDGLLMNVAGVPTPIVVARNQVSVGTTTSSFLVNGNTLFQDSSTAANNFDAITGAATFTSGTQIGPDVMFETTKLTMGDGSLLKFWKRFLLNYSSDVGMTASFIGTNDTTLDFPPIAPGTASTDVIAASVNTGIVHRMRFLVRSATCSIRVYQTSTTSATSQRFKCFWWSVGGKKMRQGRAQP